MKSSIGRAIAGAAASLLRGLGSAQATLVVRPTTTATPASTPATVTADAPASDAAVIKIEVTLNR